MPRGKRKTLVDAGQLVAAVDAASGITSIVSALHTMDLPHSCAYSVGWQRRLAQDELYKVAGTSTAYGKVCCNRVLTGPTGDLNIYFTNPFAILTLACEQSAGFRQLVADMMASSPEGLDIIYYLDKATPGNEKRWDAGRGVQCMYFSFAQLLAWFRSRRNGWLPFSYVLEGHQKSCNVTDAMLVKFMLKIFDAESVCTFSGGFGVPGPGGSVTLVRCNRHMAVGDWDQHVRTFSLKGCSGRIPCSLCQNVVGRCDYFDGYPSLLHVQSAEFDRCVKHTPATCEYLATHIRHVALHDPARLAEAEKNCGLKYDPEGVPWDETVKTKLVSPWAQYPDFMHDICASGGIGQYQLNGIILHMDSVGISPTDIDQWIQTLHVPKGMAPLPKTFCSTRIVRRATAHIRAFASEVLTAVALVGFSSMLLSKTSLLLWMSK